MQTQLKALQRKSSKASIHSITSFAGSINTKNAYKKVFKGLYDIGVTADMMRQKETEILNMFKHQNSVISGQTDDDNITEESQLPAVSSYFGNLIYICFKKYLD